MITFNDTHTEKLQEPLNNFFHAETSSQLVANKRENSQLVANKRENSFYSTLSLIVSVV